MLDEMIECQVPWL